MSTIGKHNLTINYKADWVDKDILMLHSCFQLLKDFIEKEDPFNYQRKNCKIKNQLMELYKWWENREKDVEADKVNELDMDQYQEDNKMLIKLIKIRQHLWT